MGVGGKLREATQRVLRGKLLLYLIVYIRRFMLFAVGKECHMRSSLGCELCIFLLSEGVWQDSSVVLADRRGYHNADVGGLVFADQLRYRADVLCVFRSFGREFRRFTFERGYVLYDFNIAGVREIFKLADTTV